MFRSLFKKVIILCSFYLFKLHVWCHQDISMVNYHPSGNRERQCTKSKIVTSKIICLCETSASKALPIFSLLFFLPSSGVLIITQVVTEKDNVQRARLSLLR